MTEGSRQLLKALSEASGICGHEDEVRGILVKALEGIGSVHFDRLGGVAVEKRGTADRPRVLLVGHMDEIGFVVRNITDDGFLHIMPFGGWMDQVLLAKRVHVVGSKGKVLGVIGAKPPHIVPPEKQGEMVRIRDMFVDVGAASATEVREELGISEGDPVVPDSQVAELNGGRFLLGKAWDDRVGVALAVDTLRALGPDHPNTVFAAGTVSEEKSGAGGVTVSWNTDPDVAIVLEVGITGGVPGVDEKESIERCGKGVAILFTEGGAIPSPRLRRFAQKVAQEEDIPHQISFYERGGSDGAAIHRYKIGVPYILLCVPARYIHTHNQLIAADDYDAALRLCVALCNRLDVATLEGLVP